MQVFPITVPAGTLVYLRATVGSMNKPSPEQKRASYVADHPDLADRLDSIAWLCTQESGTEQAFTGPYCDEKRAGTYRCIACNAELFDSETKFDSGSGWPSFTTPVDADTVDTRSDFSHGMVRTETSCSNCGAHLGHVFPDGPSPAGDRYCINSACITLDES